jgi:uncharacterized protein YndB with AHSA1/START domain
MRVDESAPVVAAAETEVDTDAETVWDVLTGIEAWPSWNPAVRSASLSGPVAEGSEFRWKAGPGTITSTIRQVERPGLIGWTGKSLGLSVVHVWRLESQSERTLVKTEESFAGLPARLFTGRLHKLLQRELDAGLRHLKAERRGGLRRRLLPASRRGSRLRRAGA